MPVKRLRDIVSWGQAFWGISGGHPSWADRHTIGENNDRYITESGSKVITERGSAFITEDTDRKITE